MPDDPSAKMGYRGATPAHSPGFLETGFLPLHPTVVVQQACLAGADPAVSGQ